MNKLVLVPLIVAGAFALYNAWTAAREESNEARTLKSLPPSVQHAVAQMDPASQSVFFNEYERKKKKVSVGYVLWLIGCHYIYIRKIGLQFAFWFVFMFTFGIWWIIDLFRLPGIIRTTNELVARDALQTLAIGDQFKANSPTSGTFLPPPPPSGQ